jgi:threonyl-tRNA synthetase
VRAEYDDRNEKIGYKIRDWELKKVPYMLVAGEKEKSSNTVSVRQHKKGDLGSMSREAFIANVTDLVQRKSLTV